MRRPWMVWLLLVSSILGSIFFIIFLNPKVGWGIGWSFLNGETSIAYWKAIVGLSTWAAILAAVAGGEIDLANWMFLAGEVEKFVIYLRKKFAEGNHKTNGALERHSRRVPYVTLAVLGFIPGQIYTAVALAKIYGLPTWKAYVAISIGNVLKMVAFGFGFHGLGALIRAAILWFAH